MCRRWSKVPCLEMARECMLGVDGWCIHTMLFEFLGGPLDGDIQELPDYTHEIQVPIPRPIRFSEYSDVEGPIIPVPYDNVLIYRRYNIVDTHGEHRQVFSCYENWRKR